MKRSGFETATGPVKRPRRFDFVLERDANVPLRTQLQRGLVAEIERGRLPPGAMLPGSRRLAEQLGVNRKVVVAAVDELVSQGWLETRPASGTRVAETLPALAVADVETQRKQPPSPARPQTAPVSITDGLPDARLAPLAELSRAYARAVRSLDRPLGGYGDPAGDPTLRHILSDFANQARGLSSTVDEIFLTRGAQAALALFALSTLRPGDVVAVETPGYKPAWRAFELAGAKVVYVPVDKDGLRIDVLERVAQKLSGKFKAVYVTPHHQYPTSVALAPERRMQLLSLAERFGFTIVEDDYDYEYHFDGEPLLPLHAVARSSRVVYIASFSKLLTPTVRLGYMVAPRDCMEKLRHTRELLERQGDVVLERAVAELLEDGTIQAHARRARREYKARRDHVVNELGATSALRNSFEFTVPAGGLALWLKVKDQTAESIVSKARARGLLITPGSAYLPQRALNAIRFGFASKNVSELAQVCGTLARCVRSH